MVNKYCVCLIADGTGKVIFDAMTFPNPDKDPNAKGDCRKRAEYIRQHKNEFGKRFGISIWGVGTVQPVIITGIEGVA